MSPPSTLTPPAPRAGRRVPTRYWLVLGMFLLSMLLYVDRVCISASKEGITKELGLSGTQMGWVLSIFALGYAVFQVPSGLLVDRYGPRRILSAVVTAWSIFTALTGAAQGLFSMLTYRFLFGAGEAGAFPGCARAVYSWIPTSERGMVQGLMFSGARFGAAFTLPLVAWLVGVLGWRASFGVLGLVGVLWAAFWFAWFRDNPEDHPRISDAEKSWIQAARQDSVVTQAAPAPLRARSLLSSSNVWLLMGQYFASNFTFFFALSWLFSYLKDRYGLSMVQTGFYAAAPPLAGAFGNWTAGALIDWLYRRGQWKASRQVPAVLGFSLAILGLLASTHMPTPMGAVLCLSLAVFGADMTIAPSWSVCIDIGGNHSGTVSGTMNMAGNLGSFVTALAFPQLLVWTGSYAPFFYTAAALNLLAAGAWSMIRPDRRIQSA